MMTDEILASIDAEIQRLQQARALLTGGTGTPTKITKGTGKRGRPKGSTNKPKDPAPTKATAKKRTMSAEARARISAAVKARHAAARKAAK